MMLAIKVSLIVSALSVTCLAAPANELVERQGEGQITYTVTCLGPRCTDYPPTTFQWPSGWPQPTSSSKTTVKTTSSTKKTSSTSRYTPPPETSSVGTTKRTSATTKYTTPPDTPTKTKSSEKPTKTQTEEVGPSSTRCPVPLYYQCGGYHDGQPWTGCTKCVSGAKCIWQNDWYYQCVADE